MAAEASGTPVDAAQDSSVWCMCVDQYILTVRGCPRILIAAWFVAAGLFAKPAARMFDVTANIYDTVPGSPSQIAHTKYRELFGKGSQQHDVLLLKSDENLELSSVLLKQVSEDIQSFFHSRGLHIDLMGFASASAGGMSSLANKFISEDRHSSIFVMSRTGKPIDTQVGRAELDLVAKLRDQYVKGHAKVSEKSCRSHDTSATCLLGVCDKSRNATCVRGRCICQKETCPSGGQCVSQVVNVTPRLTFVGATGLAIADKESSDEAAKDITRMDPIVIPLSFAVLSFVLQSIRILIIPISCIFCANFICFGLIDIALEGQVTISVDVPGVVEVLLVAFCFDYSLFLLMRFRQEMTHGATAEEAVSTMLRRSGKVILSSGCTLCYCFLSVLVIPLEQCQSVSAGAVIALVVAMMVNLSLAPAFLLGWPKFFAVEGAEEVSVTCLSHRDHIPREDSGQANEPLTTREKIAPRYTDHGNDNPKWHAWAKVTTSPSCSLIVLIGLAAASVPISMLLYEFDPSTDIFLVSSRDSQARKTLQMLGDDFSQGFVSPLTLILTPRPGANVPSLNRTSNSMSFLLLPILNAIDQYSKEPASAIANRSGVYGLDFWTSSTSVLKRLDLQYLREDISGSILSPMYVHDPKGGLANFEVPLQLAAAADPLSLSYVPYIVETFSQVKQLQSILNMTLNGQRSAAVALVAPNVATSGRDGERFTHQIRELVDENNADPQSGVDIFASSATSEIIDVKQATISCLPKFVATTLVGCLLMVGLLFTSVMIAVRSVVSIAFTLSTVYAVSIGVYQLGWLSDSGPVGNTGGLFFMVPFVTFTTVVGLALDYDIFLVSCIADMRIKGLPNKLAVEEGLAQTGYVITMAGLIMFIAFGGLLLSSVPSLNQVSWVFASAVILDTFVVRTVVTPALMGALGEANWWPMRHPTATII